MTMQSLTSDQCVAIQSTQHRSRARWPALVLTAICTAALLTSWGRDAQTITPSTDVTRQSGVHQDASRHSQPRTIAALFAY